MMTIATRFVLATCLASTACIQFATEPGSPSPARTSSTSASAPSAPAAQANESDGDDNARLEAVAQADCSKLSKARASGYDPVRPADLPCLAKQNAKLYVVMTCEAIVPARYVGAEHRLQPRRGVQLFPGASVEAVGVGDAQQRDGLYVDLRVKGDKDPEETQIVAECLSRAPLPFSFYAKGTKSAAMMPLFHGMYDFAMALRTQVVDVERKRGTPFVQNLGKDYEGANSQVAEFYAKLLHHVGHGSRRDITNVLTDPTLAWLTEWPDALGQAYSEGLNEPQKSKVVRAVEALQAIEGLVDLRHEYDRITQEAKFADEEAEKVPEGKRASVKQAKAAEYAARRKRVDGLVAARTAEVTRQKASVSW